MQVSAIAFSKDGIDEDINPLYCIEDESEKDRKMTVEEARELAKALG